MISSHCCFSLGKENEVPIQSTLTAPTNPTFVTPSFNCSQSIIHPQVGEADPLHTTEVLHVAVRFINICCKNNFSGFSLQPNCSPSRKNGDLTPCTLLQVLSCFSLGILCSQASLILEGKKKSTSAPSLHFIEHTQLCSNGLGSLAS